jgi:DHA2 family multidrug resistance protein-like MFS transporter
MSAETMPRAGRREWIGLAVLILPCLLISLDFTVLHLAVPALSADLRPTSTQLLWIVDIYGFLIAGSLITMGTLGDRIGRRKLLLIGGGAFGAASVLAAYSTSAEMLIATRAVLGVVGATLMPSTLSLIRNLFHDPVQRTRAIGLWITSFTAGSAIGPVVGGALLEQFWWGAAFLLGVPVMLLLLAVGPFLLPESRDPAAGRLDLVSAAMSLVAMLGVVFGVKRAAAHGLEWQAVVPIAAGLAVGAAFVHRQRGLRDPLIDVRLFGIRAFSAALTTQALALFAYAGAQFFAGQYLQLVLGLSPLRAGLWTLPSAVVGAIGTTVAPSLLRYIRPALVLGGGLLVSAIGFGVMTQVGGSAGLAVLVTGFVIISLGFGPAMTVTTDLILGAAPPARAGAASAISETSSELGLALGIALIGSIGTALYRREMADAIPPGVPPDAALAARETLGGALAVIEQVPGQQAAALLGAARAAFTNGLHLTAAISGAIMLGLALLTVAVLRRNEAAPAHYHEVEPAQSDLRALS